MPDILNDDPATFAAGLQDLTNGDSADFGFHNEARRALRDLKPTRLRCSWRTRVDRALGGRGRRGRRRYDRQPGRVPGNRQRRGRLGWGDRPRPGRRGDLFWAGTLTIPRRVVLRGLGERSVVRAHPRPGTPAIRFARGPHRGGLESLTILGDEAAPPDIGIDLTGAQFLRLRNFEVWDFRLGVCMSDGRTPFAGYNHISDFEINRCQIGVRAWRHCNQGSVREGRIFFCRDNGVGTALDISSAPP